MKLRKQEMNGPCSGQKDAPGFLDKKDDFVYINPWKSKL